jgi:DNA-binding protein YbaB
MTTPWDKQIESLMADYQRHRTDALEVGEHLRSTTGTATTGKGLVTAVVGPGGEVRSITFHSRRYRTMAPAELAQLLIDAVEQARGNALDQMAAAMPTVALAGMTYEDMLNGRVDVDAILPKDLSPSTFPLLRALLDDGNK